MNDLLNQLITQVDNEVAKPRSTKQLDYVLLDGSGSMAHKWHESLEAIDQYVAGVSAADVDTEVVLATFSSGYGERGSVDYTIARETTAKSWSRLAPEPPHCPGGSTPLYDSINIMVRSLRERNPDRCSIVIVTDGEENGSVLTDAAQARGLLDWCRSRGWQVTLIGCDFNNISMAKTLGGADDTAIGAPVKRLGDITAELSKKRAFYSKFGTPMHFTEEEKKNFGGYLTGREGGQ